ncbi:hypothetical protein GC209_05200 [bacterium]|nr:hypothetical protein [bacterium]
MLNDTQTAFLQKYLGFAWAGDGPDAENPLLVRLRQQALDRRPDVAAMAAAFPDLTGPLRDLTDAVEQALAVRDTAAAKETLTALTGFLDGLSRRAADLAALARARPVTLSLAAVDWRRACDEVAAEVDSVSEAILAEIDDPDAGAQAAKLDALADRLRAVGPVLTEAVRAVINAPEPAARTKAARAALATVEDSLAFLNGSGLLAHLLIHPLNADVPQHDQRLIAPLTALRSALAGL